MAVPLFVQKKWPLLVAAAAFLIGVIVFCEWIDWSGITFKVKVGDISSILGPLVVASAVVERAVEILISPWRDEGATKRQKQLTNAQALPVSDTNKGTVQEASDRLDAYKADTQQYAFAVSIVISTLVSIVGIRVLQAFLDASSPKPQWASTDQQTAFQCIDVALSAALLSGGADGMHSLITAITKSFDAVGDTAQQKSNQTQTQTQP